jgi:hypothetical protein
MLGTELCVCVLGGGGALARTYQSSVSTDPHYIPPCWLVSCIKRGLLSSSLVLVSKHPNVGSGCFPGIKWLKREVDYYSPLPALPDVLLLSTVIIHDREDKDRQ